LSDAPEPLLVERRVETGDDAYVDRITADGGVWTGGTVSASLAGGELTFERSEGGRWNREGTLPPDALERLRRAIADSGFFAAPPEFHPPMTVIHASSEVWTAELDGRRHTSTMFGRGVTQAEPLAAMATALEGALAAIDEGQ
jgi:hypothetical protein